MGHHQQGHRVADRERGLTMFDPKRKEDIDYIKGFDHGCDYIVAEIERYIEAHKFEPRITGPIETLLLRLKGPTDEKSVR